MNRSLVAFHLTVREQYELLEAYAKYLLPDGARINIGTISFGSFPIYKVKADAFNRNYVGNAPTRPIKDIIEEIRGEVVTRDATSLDITIYLQDYLDGPKGLQSVVTTIYNPVLADKDKSPYRTITIDPTTEVSTETYTAGGYVLCTIPWYRDRKSGVEERWFFAPLKETKGYSSTAQTYWYAGGIISVETYVRVTTTELRRCHLPQVLEQLIMEYVSYS